MSFLLPGLLAAAFSLGAYLFFRNKAKRRIRCTWALRKQVFHDYVDISGWVYQDMTPEQATAEIEYGYDVAGMIFERAKVEREKEDARKRESFDETRDKKKTK
jgi:hypothetical protein